MVADFHAKVQQVEAAVAAQQVGSLTSHHHLHYTTRCWCSSGGVGAA
jgi:hypothetical protein